jgi:hypothetical protein
MVVSWNLPFKTGEVLGREQSTGATATREGLERVGHADIAAHPVVRRDLRPAIKPVAQVKVAAGDDIGGHGLDPENARNRRGSMPTPSSCSPALRLLPMRP